MLLLLFSGTSYAQLVAWNFGPATRGDEKTSVSTFADPCMEASELSRGPGVRPQRATYSFAGLWPGCNSMLGAVRQGAFYEFSLKARKGCLFSLKGLAFVLGVHPTVRKRISSPTVPMANIS